MHHNAPRQYTREVGQHPVERAKNPILLLLLPLPLLPDFVMRLTARVKAARELVCVRPKPELDSGLSGGPEGSTRQAHDEDDACRRQHAVVIQRLAQSTSLLGLLGLLGPTAVRLALVRTCYDLSQPPVRDLSPQTAVPNGKAG